MAGEGGLSEKNRTGLDGLKAPRRTTGQGRLVRGSPGQAKSGQARPGWSQARTRGQDAGVDEG